MYEHMRNLYYGPSRDDCAWITARCAHCQTQKIQKGKGPVKPILSEYPGQRMVLDLMDFRVSAKVICLALFLSHVLYPFFCRSSYLIRSLNIPCTMNESDTVFERFQLSG